MLSFKEWLQEGLAASIWTGSKRTDIKDFTKRKKDVLPAANDTQPSKGEDLNPVSKLMLNKGLG